MKTFKLLLLSISLLLPLMGIIGCETESSDQASISITPNTTELDVGDSQVFTAAGWQDYSWSLSIENVGVLSTTTGDSTTYTAVLALSSNTTQVLTVSANGNSGISSNATALTAEALITHISDSPQPNANLEISPSSAEVTSGGATSFTATGGNGIYAWTLATGTTDSGTIASSGSTATYTANAYTTASNNATISVSSDGQSVSATIVHN
jgi:hypothetical protein